MKETSVKKLLDLVKDSYGEIAADFNVTRKKALWPEVIRLAGEAKNGEKILDVGCGNGRLSEALKDKKIEYLGVDNSEALIKLARQNYPERQFLTADILDLSVVPDSFFDRIFCLAVLHHLPGQELQMTALKQLAGKIKPDGRVIISVWNLWRSPKHRRLLFLNFCFKIFGKHREATESGLGWRDLIFPWKNARGQKTGRRYYHAFTGRELKKIIRRSDAGLKIEEVYKDKYNYWLILRKEE